MEDKEGERVRWRKGWVRDVRGGELMGARMHNMIADGRRNNLIRYCT